MLRNRGIKAIITSPLSRAKVTADIAAAQLGLPVQVDDGLREVAFGIKEGQPMGEWFQPWVDGLLTPEGAESFAALTTRAVAAVNRCLVRREAPASMPSIVPVPRAGMRPPGPPCGREPRQQPGQHGRQVRARNRGRRAAQ